MPLLDHFHPPLRGPRRWEGFHHGWASQIAEHLNQELLPEDYFAEPEISLGPELEIDVAAMELASSGRSDQVGTATALWAPARPNISLVVDFAHLDTCEVRVYQELGGAELRAAIELVSPANKDRPSSRRMFAAKCAGYLKHGVSVIILDVVTLRTANLHADLLEALDVSLDAPSWESPTRLYAVAYHAVPLNTQPRVDVWTEPLALGTPLPTLPLWLRVDLCVPLCLEESYAAACVALRIRA
jgi:hypothetical protein